MGIMQQDLAKKADCDRNTISRLETGKIGVSSALAHRVSDALGVEFDSLVLELPPDGAIVAETEDEQEVLLAMRRLGPDNAREIHAYAMGYLRGGTRRAAEVAATIERELRAAGPTKQ